MPLFLRLCCVVIVVVSLSPVYLGVQTMDWVAWSKLTL